MPCRVSKPEFSKMIRVGFRKGNDSTCLLIRLQRCVDIVMYASDRGRRKTIFVQTHHQLAKTDNRIGVGPDRFDSIRDETHQFIELQRIGQALGRDADFVKLS